MMDIIRICLDESEVSKLVSLSNQVELDTSSLTNNELDSIVRHRILCLMERSGIN